MPSLSQEEPSLDSVYEWYVNQELALKLYKKSAMEGKVVQFFGMSHLVVRQYFVKLQRELDLIACLAIHAAAEAALMVDFFSRGRGGVKGLNKEIKFFLRLHAKIPAWIYHKFLLSGKRCLVFVMLS